MTFLAAVACFIVALLLGIISSAFLIGGGANDQLAKRIGQSKRNNNILLSGLAAGLFGNLFTALGVWIAVSG